MSRFQIKPEINQKRIETIKGHNITDHTTTLLPLEGFKFNSNPVNLCTRRELETRGTSILLPAYKKTLGLTKHSRALKEKKIKN